MRKIGGVFRLVWKSKTSAKLMKFIFKLCQNKRVIAIGQTSFIDLQ